MRYLVFPFLYFFMIQNAFADFRCMSEVHYRWKKAEATEETEVFWTLLKVEKKLEPEAKQAMKDKMVEGKEEALKKCQEMHENVSGCISSKFASMDSVLRRLDFTARKKLEEAVAEDCQAQGGVCLGASASEMKCEQFGEAPEEEEGKKGKKKKKKKKK